MLQVNNHRDHVHLLIGCRTSIRLDDMVKEVKEHSTRWINSNRLVKGKFQWQEGYGAFSVASWNYDVIYNYIKNQEEHHTRKSFIDEYEELLTQEGVEYDKKYIFHDPNMLD